MISGSTMATTPARMLYSGTVGAAMEGALNGKPAMAVSLGHEREDTYDNAAALAVGF
ncbi:MAG: 5'/3'-nucleotidase SurE [Christensenellales bacterium]